MCKKSENEGLDANCLDSAFVGVVKLFHWFPDSKTKIFKMCTDVRDI